MGFGNREQLYEMRDRGAIAEKTAIALQIAADRGDVEVVAKYRELSPASSGATSYRAGLSTPMNHV